MERRKIHLVLAALAVAAAAFAIYYGTLGAGFVYDDNEQLIKNSWITDFRNIPKVFSSHSFGFSSQPYLPISYRPMFHTIAMAEYALFGLEPWGWHLVNVSLHALNAILVFFLLLGIAPSEKGPFRFFPALAGALLFTALPVQSETVSWVGCIPELFYTFFLLSAFLFYKASTNGKSRLLARALSVLLFLAAAFTKESAIVFPALLLAYDFWKEKGSLTLSRAPAMMVKRYWPYALAGIFYLAVRSSIVGGLPKRLHTDITDFQFILSVPVLLVRYLIALILPIRDYPLQLFDPVLSPMDPAFIAAIAVLIAVSAGLLYFRKCLGPRLLLALAFFLPLLPALYSPGISRTPFADRYLYFPSIGLALVFAILMNRLLEKGEGRKALRAVAFGAVIALVPVYSAWAAYRSAAWKSDLTLWTEALKGSEKNYGAWHSLGHLDYKEGRNAEAIAKLERSLALNIESAHPDPTLMLLTRKALASSYHKSGLLDKAERTYGDILAVAPEDPIAAYNMGLLTLKRGLADDAIYYLKTALLFTTTPAQKRDVYLYIGSAYLQKGLKGEAARSFEEGLRFSPGDPELISGLEAAGGL